MFRQRLYAQRQRPNQLPYPSELTDKVIGNDSLLNPVPKIITPFVCFFAGKPGPFRDRPDIDAALAEFAVIRENSLTGRGCPMPCKPGFRAKSRSTTASECDPRVNRRIRGIKYIAGQGQEIHIPIDRGGDDPIPGIVSCRRKAFPSSGMDRLKPAKGRPKWISAAWMNFRLVIPERLRSNLALSVPGDRCFLYHI